MLGARIAALRLQAGLSQAELAKRLAVSASAVGMYEQGRREPSMDRIVALERTGDTFRMPHDFNVDALFRDSYGIYLPEGENPVLVKLRASERESAYLQDLPLHPSQVMVGPGLFVLRVIPNPGFVMELCKRADRLEVLEPLELRQAVLDALKNAIQLYEH